LEGHKILQVAGSKIGLSFSVLRKSRFFYWAPTVSCLVGIGRPSSEIKMGGVKMTTFLYLVPKLSMGGSVPPLFRTPSCCVHAKLYLFTCIKTSVFQAEKFVCSKFLFIQNLPKCSTSLSHVPETRDVFWSRVSSPLLCGTYRRIAHSALLSLETISAQEHVLELRTANYSPCGWLRSPTRGLIGFT